MKKLLIAILPIIFLFAFASPAQGAPCEIGANIIYNNPGYFALLRQLYPDCETITVTTLVAPAFILEHEDVFLEWLNAASDSGIALNLRIDPMGPIGQAEAQALGYILGEIVANDPNSPIVGLIFNNEPNLIPGYSSAEYVASLLAFYTGYLNFFSDNPEIPIPDNLTLYIAPISVGAPNTLEYLQAIVAMLAAHPEIDDINLAMNLYVPVGSDPAAYAALVQAQIDIFAQAGIDVSNIFISEIGLLGPDGTPIEDFSDYTQEEIEQFLTDLFAEIWDVLAPYGLDGITASFFFDSDGDGIPDQTWLVIVGPDGRVQIIKFDDLKLGVCVMEYIMNGGNIDTGALADMIDNLQAGESITAEDICQGTTDVYADCVEDISGCILYNFFLEFGAPCASSYTCLGGERNCAVMVEASETFDENPCNVPGGGCPSSHSRNFKKNEMRATARVTEFRVPFVREMAQRIHGTPWSANRAFADGMLLIRLGWSGFTWRPSTGSFDTEKEWRVRSDGRWISGRIFGTDREDETQGDRGRGAIYAIYKAAKEIEFALGAPGLYGSAVAQREGGLAQENSKFKIQNSKLANATGSNSSANSCAGGTTGSVKTAAKLPEFETRLTEAQGSFGCSLQLSPSGDGCFDWVLSAQAVGCPAHMRGDIVWDGGKMGFPDQLKEGTVTWRSGYWSLSPICPGDVSEFTACAQFSNAVTDCNFPSHGECCCTIKKLADGSWTECPATITPVPPSGPVCDALSGELSKFCVNSGSYEDISGASGRFKGSATKKCELKRVCDSPPDDPTPCKEDDDFSYVEEWETTIRAETYMTPYYSYLGSCQDNVMYTTLGELDHEDEPLDRGFFNNFRIPGPWFDDKGAQISMNAGITFNACGEGFAAGVRPYSAYLPRLGGVYQTMKEFETWITPPDDRWEQLLDMWAYPIGKEETLKAKAEEAKKAQMSQKVTRLPKPRETLTSRLGTKAGSFLASL